MGFRKRFGVWYWPVRQGLSTSSDNCVFGCCTGLHFIIVAALSNMVFAGGDRDGELLAAIVGR